MLKIILNAIACISILHCYRIYNIKSAKQKQCYKGAVGDSGVLLKLQLDPSGQFAVTSCTDKSLALLDFKTGDLLATMFGHSELATGVKFMPDLKRLVSVSSDGCIFVWRLPPELTESMKGRLEEMGKLPMEAVNGDINRWVGGVWVGVGGNKALWLLTHVSYHVGNPITMMRHWEELLCFQMKR